MERTVVILGGGTATNELVPLFNEYPFGISYILPISDNGGSTSEIIRVIGGPAIGDIRSRLTRLIPEYNKELRELLSFRLDSSPEIAKDQWGRIVDGTHILWRGINLSTREIVRSFLVHIHVELLKRSRASSNTSNSRKFRFELANVGNLFLTGARLFIGSLDSAIELFMKITDISKKIQVLPCINTNFTYHIGAILSNGLVITGQSQISHPSLDNSYPSRIHETRPSSPTKKLSNDSVESQVLKPDRALLSFEDQCVESDEESGNTPSYVHPELKKSQLIFHKANGIQPLSSPIKRVFYISPYGEEICPTAQSRVTSRLANADLIIYSIGSLMTSIVPIILLKGVGRAIIDQHTPCNCGKKRILLLNGSEDRETYGLTALNYVQKIVESAQYSMEKSGHVPNPEYCRYVTHIFYLQEPRVMVDVGALTNLGITCVQISRSEENAEKFDMKDLKMKLDNIADF